MAVNVQGAATNPVQWALAVVTRRLSCKTLGDQRSAPLRGEKSPQDQVVSLRRPRSWVVKGPKAEIEEVKKAKESSGGYSFADSRACWLRKASDREVLTRSGKAVHQLGFALLK